MHANDQAQARAFRTSPAAHCWTACSLATVHPSTLPQVTDSEEQPHNDGWKNPPSEHMRSDCVVVKPHLRTVPSELMSGGNASRVVQIDRVYDAHDPSCCDCNCGARNGGS